MGQGKRFPIAVTRKIIREIQKNKLDEVPTKKDAIFGLHIPEHIDGVDSKHLLPEESWEDKVAYREKANTLLQSFDSTMTKFDWIMENNKFKKPFLRA